MENISAVLKDNSLVLILAYVPTGLGHLRVTDALYHGLPQGVISHLLGSHDKSLQYIHRITSIHPIARSLLEWTQTGKVEDIATLYYRRFFALRAAVLYEQLVTILDQRIELPQRVLIVSTHFGLGHGLSEIKDRLIKEKKVKVYLAIVVTDDSPQHIWYTPGADLTFVPSESTKRKLEQYAKKINLPAVNICVVPYPINSTLSKELTSVQNEDRRAQLTKNATVPIHVSIPISGAAVGLQYFRVLIDTLYTLSNSFVFHVITKLNSHTENFVSDMLTRSFVKISSAEHDREIVDKYTECYMNQVIALEVTKPSEQCFKALINPKHRGGSILLFSKPVGRQEYDNLNFLKRHGLIPTVKESQKLLEKSSRDQRLVINDELDLFNEACSWRGIELPEDPALSASFIWWCLREGIFRKMFHGTKIHADDPNLHELGEDGVVKIWTLISKYLQENA